MSVVVAGCGRSGTNMVLEILSGNSALKASEQVENKRFFRGGVYDDGYLTKCDCVYFDVDMFNATMERNPGLKVVWTMRDPRDMVLSKIRRGQPRSEGGDNKALSDDGTPDGAVQNIEEMVEKYRNAVSRWRGRVRMVRMEDLLRDMERETRNLCAWLGLAYEPKMLDFMSRMRNPDKVRRYSGVDKGELEKWRNWKSCYGGFFVDGGYDVESLFVRVLPLVREFGYGHGDMHVTKMWEKGGVGHYTGREDMYFEYLGKLLPEFKGGSVLEVGPGTGLFAKRMMERFDITSYSILDIETKIGDSMRMLDGMGCDFFVSQDYASLFGRDFDLFVSNVCLPETPGYYRETLCEGVFPGCRSAFVIGGGAKGDPYNEWIKKVFGSHFKHVSVADTGYCSTFAIGGHNED